MERGSEFWQALAGRVRLMCGGGRPRVGTAGFTRMAGARVSGGGDGKVDVECEGEGEG